MKTDRELLELQLLESGSAPFFNSIGQVIEVEKSIRDRNKPNLL